MKHNYSEGLCSLNTRGTSISCGFALLEKIPEDPDISPFTIALRLARGDPKCAQESVIHVWRDQMKDHWGYGFLWSLSFVWLWILQFCL